MRMKSGVFPGFCETSINRETLWKVYGNISVFSLTGEKVDA